MDKLIKREELYNLVWSKPITKIAKDYRVSDSAIIKICKKMEIPRPGLGYWTKVECGKKVEKTPLPKLSKKGVDRHYLWRQGYSEGRTDQEGTLHPLIAKESASEHQVVVGEELDNAHPLVATNIKRFRNAKADEKGILRPRAARHFDFSITSGTVDRALRIMDALIKAFEVRNWVFRILEDPKPGMSVEVMDEEIRFSIAEVVKGVEHVLTDKEQRAGARGDWVWPPRYDYIATGKLKLSIDVFYSYRGRSSWGDAKIQRVETSLNKFCAGLVQYALATKQKRKKDEVERRKHKRESDARERIHTWNQIHFEMRSQLFKEVKSWRLAEEIRAYVLASRKLAPPEAGIQECHDAWSQWALAYADFIDPLEGGSPLDLGEDHGANRLKYRY